MTATATQSVPAVLAERLGHRFGELGVTMLQATPDGRAVPRGSVRWIAQLLIESEPFAAALANHWDELGDQGGPVVELWPGVAIVPLPTQRRRPTGLDDFDRPLLAALLLGPELIDSEQLRLVCDIGQLDLQATIARIDTAELVGPSEARRLASVLAWMCQDTAEIEKRMAEIQNMSKELLETYEELSLLYKLSANMVMSENPARFLLDACRELHQVVGLRWMALQLIDAEPRLENLAGQVFTAGSVGCGAAKLKRVGAELLQRFGSGTEPTIIDDASTLGMAILPQIASDLLIIPLRFEDKPLGILFGSEKLERAQISSVDSKLCHSLGSSITIFLENMMLYADMRAMFLGTLHALTAAIDAKDSYTHGHSERVAMMSRRLAEAAGFDEHTCERVYISGLVHDVGKIGVPEAVLCKPGRLTDEEFEQIKLHPTIGAGILQDIRQMQDLIPGVLHHHERWDGRGYPDRLAGDQIPTFGRLIGLADSFDAMSSDRTYRPAMEVGEVLAEVRSCRGTQFDPQLAEVFVELDFAPFYEMMAKHWGQHVRESA